MGHALRLLRSRRRDALKFADVHCPLWRFQHGEDGACIGGVREAITNSCVEQIGAAILAGPRAHTHMVFDEFHFRNAGKNGTPLTIEECIRLLDSEFVGQLSVRYKTITVPAIPRIFTTNLTLSCEADHIFPPPQNANHAEALARRYRRIRVDEPMYAAQGHDAPMAQPAQPVGL